MNSRQTLAKTFHHYLIKVKNMQKNWEIIIGIEIHIQLNTDSKIFSSEQYSFGSEPNCNIGVVSTGQPGSMPILNKKAVDKAIAFGLATNSTISLISRFDRKSYFYPDCPKNYQITQYHHPIIQGGSITCDIEGETYNFPIHHAHLEEDTGMLKHFTKFSGIDFNRAGSALLEIVSDSCFRSPKEAVFYAMQIKSIVEYIDASDCNMAQGNFRMDANISVRRKGETHLRNKIEIKNMNSFFRLEKSLEAEADRQIQFYSTNPTKELEMGTYRFDEETATIILMRTKEQTNDYGYIPEPDIPPIVLSPEYIENIKKTLPELPREKYNRYKTTLAIPEQPAQLLISSHALANYFETALKKCKNAKSLANWITVEFAGRTKEKSLWEIGIISEHIADLVNLIDNNTITGKIAKKLADVMVERPGISPYTLIKENPEYAPITNEQEIQQIIETVMAQNPTSVADYRAGVTKALGYLIGQVMKISGGKASPQTVNKLLLKKLKTN
jgi:aspartyl-tRNA(Asn)/glutamyl-tRNA(Gln) amidotransferase subunit B